MTSAKTGDAACANTQRNSGLVNNTDAFTCKQSQKNAEQKAKAAFEMRAHLQNWRAANKDQVVPCTRQSNIQALCISSKCGLPGDGCRQNDDVLLHTLPQNE